MTKVDFFIQNLSGGGAERVVLNLMNNLDREKYNINLVLLEKRGAYLNKLEKDINVITYEKIFKNRKFNFILNLIRGFYYLRKSDSEIIFTQYHTGKLISFLIPLIYNKKKIVYRETNIPTEITKISRKGVKILDKLFYKYGIYNFQTVVVQSNDMKDNLLSILKKQTKNLIIINNPIDCNFLKKIENAFFKKDRKMHNKLRLISVGRLNIQKGYDILIKSLSKINDVDYELLILGEGEEREKLECLIKKLKLEKKIYLIGFKENPYEYFSNSDIYISSSRFEGFPNSVIEANYFRLPVISNNYKGGINEIILENINGKIIDISNEILLRNALKQKYDIEKIREITQKRYDIKKIILEYENIL